MYIHIPKVLVTVSREYAARFDAACRAKVAVESCSLAQVLT